MLAVTRDETVFRARVCLKGRVWTDEQVVAESQRGLASVAWVSWLAQDETIARGLGELGD